MPPASPPPPSPHPPAAKPRPGDPPGPSPEQPIPTGPDPAPPRLPLRERLPDWLGPMLGLMAIWALFAAIDPAGFLSVPTAAQILKQTVVLSIVAIAAALVLMGGGLDLSVGSTVALSSMVIAWMLAFGGCGPWAAAGAGLAAGLLCGLLNGLLVVSLRITPFVVTLGTMGVYRGLTKGIGNSQNIYPPENQLPHLMSGLPGEAMLSLRLFGQSAAIPWGVLIALVVGLCVLAFLRCTVPGRRILATGSNPAAAALCGVRVGRIRVLTYALCGLLCGIAGILEFATLTVGDVGTQAGLELNAIAAAVVGGAALSGGRGSIIGAVCGALLLTVIGAGLNTLQLSPHAPGWLRGQWLKEIVTGLIIILAVALDRLRRARDSSA